MSLVVVGAVLQVTVRDAIPFPVAGMFYALPRTVLLVLAVIAVLTASGGWRRVGAGLALVLLGSWIAIRDIGWQESTATPAGASTVVCWNIGHDLIDDVAVVDGFLDSSPLIVGLVETGKFSDEWFADWKARHPEYDFVRLHPGCLLIVRGRVSESGYQRLDYNSHAVWADFESQGITVRAVVVDIAANPWISRREPLAKLEALLSQRNDIPQVVMGDFNTPDDSVWYAGIERSFREVFEVAGSGFAPTWPWPAPVLKLDQIWINAKIRVHRSWRTTTWRSDHRPVWAELDLLTGEAISPRPDRRGDALPGQTGPWR